MSVCLKAIRPGALAVKRGHFQECSGAELTVPTCSLVTIEVQSPLSDGSTYVIRFVVCVP